MILFHAKRDGTVTTTPDLVPQGSSMQDLVVVSEFDYAYCAIKLYPASGEYIEDIPCTTILQRDFSTIFTAPLPPKATVVAGSVDYQLVFTAADGTTQTTLAGSFTVPRGVPVSTPGSAEGLSVKTIGDIYTIMANTYGLFVGHERDIYQSLTDIAALKKTIASAGYVTIPVTEWEDGSPTIATFTLDGFGAGMTAMLIPADSNTQTAAREARLSAYPVAFPIDSDTQNVEIIRANADKAPEIPLRFTYLILKTDASVVPTVAIIGVDAYGEGGGTAGGVDESAVRAIITAMLGNVDNVRQYSADNPPPYPVTSVNGKTGAVSLPIPSEAADVKADPAGTAEIMTAALRQEVNNSLDARLKSADLPAKLDEYRSAKGLIDKTVSDLVNYYTQSQTLSKDEINALVSAIPKFDIEVVTSLPTANISDATVYLVKSGDDDTNLYTEYIRAGGKWEKLGTQTVDLTGYATEAWVNDILAAYVKTVDMEAYVVGLLKSYIHKEEGKGLSTNDYTDADKAAVTKAASDSAAAVNTANQAKQTADDVKQMAESGELDGAPGTPGPPGYTPIRGIDYWTAEDVAAMDADNKAYIIEELAKRNQQKIPVVNSVSEMTDTDLLYLMVKDGSLWYYAYTKVYKPAKPMFTNVLPAAIDTDGSIFNGIGYKDGLRTSESTGAYTKEEGCTATGYIACNKGDIVYMRGISIHSGRSQAMPYNSSFERYGNPMYGSTWTKLENGDLSFTVTLGQASGYINIVGKTPFADDAIISLNKPIAYSDPVEAFEWTAIQPLVYTDHTADIQALQSTVNEHDAKISKLLAGNSDAQSIRTWDKPVYDTAPVTLLGDDRAKPDLTSTDYSVEAVYAKYDALMAAHPKYITAPIPYGRSAVNTTKAPNYAGHDLRCYEFREPAGVLEPGGVTYEMKPKIIIMSGVHAEFAGVYGLYYALEEIATNPEFDDIKRNAHIMVIPCANPFVLSNQTVSGWTTSHVNANGVAIHNNFGVDHSASGTVGAFNYGGASPYSEPETVFIDNILKANKDAIAFISCHNFDYDTYYGTRVIWGSSATAYMCNLVTRLADKMSKAWLRDERYKTALPSAIESNWTGGASDVDYRLGYAQMSTSEGTEQKNALLYNIQATNLEVARIMKVFSGSTSCSSAVMTRGAEVYANWIRTILAAYQPADKRDHSYKG